MFFGRQSRQEQYRKASLGRVWLKVGELGNAGWGHPAYRDTVTPHRDLSWVNGLWFHCSRLSPPSKPTNSILPGMDFTLFSFINGMDGDEFNPKAFEQEPQEQVGFDFKVHSGDWKFRPEIQAHESQAALRVGQRPSRQDFKTPT